MHLSRWLSEISDCHSDGKSRYERITLQGSHVEDTEDGCLNRSWFICPVHGVPHEKHIS